MLKLQSSNMLVSKFSTVYVPVSMANYFFFKTDTSSPNFVYEYPGDRSQLEEEDTDMKMVQSKLTIDAAAVAAVGEKKYA